MSVSRRDFISLSGAAAASTLVASLETASAQSGAPLKIGFTVSQTGGLAVFSKTSLLAREIWRDKVNANGGLLGRPVELVYYDDQSSSTVVGGLYSKLIDVDKVDVLLGSYGTMVTNPIMPMMKQRGRFFFGIFATWANEALRYDRYFHMAPYAAKGARFFDGFTEIAAANGAKSLAILVADSEGTLVWQGQNRSAADRLGLKVVYDQKYPLNTIEFGSILNAIDANKPDAVFIGSYPSETTAIMRAMEEYDLGDNYLMFGGGMIGLQSATALKTFGPKLNGIVNYNFYVPEKSLQFEGTADFFKAYDERAEKEGLDPLGFYIAPYSYAQCQVLGAAITACKSTDDDALSKYMHATQFSTIVGDVKFGPTGEWIAPRVLQTQFQNIKGNDLDQFRKPGTQVILWPKEFQTGQLIAPYSKARKS